MTLNKDYNLDTIPQYDEYMVGALAQKPTKTPRVMRLF